MRMRLNNNNIYYQLLICILIRTRIVKILDKSLFKKEVNFVLYLRSSHILDRQKNTTELESILQLIENLDKDYVKSMHKLVDIMGESHQVPTLFSRVAYEVKTLQNKGYDQAIARDNTEKYKNAKLNKIYLKDYLKNPDTYKDLTESEFEKKLTELPSDILSKLNSEQYNELFDWLHQEIFSWLPSVTIFGSKSGQASPYYPHTKTLLKIAKIAFLSNQAEAALTDEDHQQILTLAILYGTEELIETFYSNFRLSQKTNFNEYLILKDLFQKSLYTMNIAPLAFLAKQEKFDSRVVLSLALDHSNKYVALKTLAMFAVQSANFSLLKIIFEQKLPQEVSGKNIELKKLQNEQIMLQDFFGNTLLHYACDDSNHKAIHLKLLGKLRLNNRTKCVKYLLDLGADPNIVNNLGETSLYLACKYNLTEIVALLLQKSSSEILTRTLTQTHNYNYLETIFNQIPEKILNKSTRSEMLDIIDRIQKQNISKTDLKIYREKVKTTLKNISPTILSQEDRNKILTIIDQHRDEDKSYTPAHWACYWGNTAILKLLYEFYPQLLFDHNMQWHESFMLLSLRRREKMPRKENINAVINFIEEKVPNSKNNTQLLYEANKNNKYRGILLLNGTGGTLIGGGLSLLFGSIVKLPLLMIMVIAVIVAVISGVCGIGIGVGIKNRLISLSKREMKKISFNVMAESNHLSNNNVLENSTGLSPQGMLNQLNKNAPNQTGKEKDLLIETEESIELREIDQKQIELEEIKPLLQKDEKNQNKIEIIIPKAENEIENFPTSTQRCTLI